MNPNLSTRMHGQAPLRLKVRTNKDLNFIIAVRPEAKISQVANRALNVYLQLSGIFKQERKQLTVAAVKQGAFFMPKSQIASFLLSKDEEIEVIIVKAKPKYPNSKNHQQPPEDITNFSDKQLISHQMSRIVELPPSPISRSQQAEITPNKRSKKDKKERRKEKRKSKSFQISLPKEEESEEELEAPAIPQKKIKEDRGDANLREVKNTEQVKVREEVKIREEVVKVREEVKVRQEVVKVREEIKKSTKTPPLLSIQSPQSPKITFYQPQSPRLLVQSMRRVNSGDLEELKNFSLEKNRESKGKYETINSVPKSVLQQQANSTVKYNPKAQERTDIAKETEQVEAQIKKNNGIKPVVVVVANQSSSDSEQVQNTRPNGQYQEKFKEINKRMNKFTFDSDSGEQPI